LAKAVLEPVTINADKPTVNVNEALDKLLQNIDVVHRFAEKSRSYRRLKELEA
jgi:hypothetical protein